MYRTYTTTAIDCDHCPATYSDTCPISVSEITRDAARRGWLITEAPIMTPTRPCCRPASSHDWQPLPGDATYVTCTRCGRLASYQRGGRLDRRGRLRMYNYPEMEQVIRERAARYAAQGAT